MRFNSFFLGLIFLPLVSALSSDVHAEIHPFVKTRPFVTDGCTAFAEGTHQDPNLWKECCVTHDLYLWAGGSKKYRIQADQNLKKCVSEFGGKLRGNIVYWGVRLGSISPIKIHDKRWGNAWGDDRQPFAALTLDEVEALRITLDRGAVSESLYKEFVVYLDSLMLP